MAESGEVRLEIYDLIGHKMKALVESYQSAGIYRVGWNSLDDSGKRISSGIYLYRITIKSEKSIFTKSMKMILLK